MSDTESFEYALWKAIDDCKIDENTDTITGSYTKSLSNQDRVVAAHIREMRDMAHQQYDRGFRDGTQQEYHRGFEDGRHSMDAEHRAIATRLRALPLDGGSHENLSQIAYAIWHSDWGWTKGACSALRDKLIDLMGGVSDGTTEPMTTDEFIKFIEEDTRKLVSESNHQSDKNGDSCETGGADDTCDSQYRGACAAGDGRDSGEQTEVSDGRADAIGASEDVGRNDVRVDDCGCGDSGESEVTDERLADDCGVDTGCGDGGGDLHMAGLVAYDVLDNERRKAIAELRKVCTELDESVWTWIEDVAIAIGAQDEPNDEYESMLPKITDRLIHLLGGDQPSGIDVLRAMDAESDEDGTCPNDDITSSITDELRERIRGVCKVSGLSGEKLYGIADRIDEQFDRICQQQEDVLQSTISEVVEERDNLLDLLRDACDEYKSLDQRSSETSANFHAMRDRVWSAEAERDELRAKLDSVEVAMNRAAGRWAKADAERRELRDELNKANGENKGLRLSIDEQKEAISQRKKTIKKLTRDNEKVWKTVHELQAKLDAIRDTLDG